MSVKYPVVPSCLSYHPKSELKDRPGYYPNISSQQLEAVNDLATLLEEEDIDFNCDEEDTFLKLLRFLRARKFHVKNAMAMIREDVRWRQADNRLQLRQETAEQVLGCDLSKMYTYFPTWVQGLDKQLRPVSYRQFGKFEVWNVLKLTSMDRLVRFHAWETEVALRSMYEQSRINGYNIETFVIVIDAAGWNLRLATNDAFTFIKGMATTDSDHYPERLGTLFVINAPSVLSYAWRIIQGFLDNVTKQKIKIFSSSQDEWLPALLEHIDIDQIPRQYGGNAPDPTPEEALKSMNPVVEGNDDSTISSDGSVCHVDQGVQTDDLYSYFAAEDREKGCLMC